jgi:hypothetical protein
MAAEFVIIPLPMIIQLQQVFAIVIQYQKINVRHIMEICYWEMLIMIRIMEPMTVLQVTHMLNVWEVIRGELL